MIYSGKIRTNNKFNIRAYYPSNFCKSSDNFDAFSHSNLKIDYIVKKYKKVVILGDNGSGKTTNLLYLFNKYKKIKDYLSTNSYSFKIPVLLDFSIYRNLDRENWLIEQMKVICNNWYQDKLIQALKNGKFILLIDNIDKVKYDDFFLAIKEINEFLYNYHNNKFILSFKKNLYYDYFNLEKFYIRNLNSEEFKLFLLKKNFEVNLIDDFLNNLDVKLSNLCQNPLNLLLFFELCTLKNREKIITKGELFKEFIFYLVQDSVKSAHYVNIRLIPEVLILILSKLCFIFSKKGEYRYSSFYFLNQLTRVLNEFESKSIIKKGETSVNNLVEFLTYVQLIELKDDFIKFKYSSYQDFFAAYHLYFIEREDLSFFMDDFRWKDIFLFYIGFKESDLRVVKEFIRKGDIFERAEAVISSYHLLNEEIISIFKRLINVLNNTRYEFNRDNALMYLSKLIKNKYIPEMAGFVENIEKKEYMDKLNKDLKIFKYSIPEKKFILHDQKIRYGMEDQTDDIIRELKKTEDKFIYLEEILVDYDKSKLDKLAEQMLKNLKSNKKTQKDKLWSLWIYRYLSNLNYEIILENFNKNELLKLFPYNKNTDDKKEIIYYGFKRLIYEKYIHNFLRVELGINGTYELCSENFIYELQDLVRNLDFDRFLFSSIFKKQIELDYSRGLQNLSDYLKNLSNPYAIKLVFDLKSVKFNDDILEFLKSSFDKVSDKKKICIIKIFKSQLHFDFSLFLINKLNNKLSPCVVKSILNYLYIKHGGKYEILFKESLDSEEPEVYNKVFEILYKIDKIKKLKQYAEIQKKTKIEEGKEQHLIKVYEDNHTLIRIGEEEITLGPVSGEIFFILASFSYLGKYLSSNFLIEKLENSGFFLNNNSLKTRIYDIRKSIKNKFGNTVDPQKIIESKPRYGYKLNTDVKISKNYS